jgi:hypothetical protein
MHFATRGRWVSPTGGRDGDLAFVDDGLNAGRHGARVAPDATGDLGVHGTHQLRHDSHELHGGEPCRWHQHGNADQDGGRRPGDEPARNERPLPVAA